MLSIKNASVSINQKTILDKVSIDVSSGEFVALVGPNGAGKSTALKVLSGDLALTSGTAELHSKALDKYTPQALAQLRGVMTQTYDINFPFKSHEVVEMAHYAFADSVPSKTLKSYSDKAMSLTKVSHLSDHIFTQLSGGEQQRVQLSRVLTQLSPALENKQLSQNGAPFLLIDEPTSSLDLYHQHHVMALAETFAQRGAGVLAVVHDLALAAAFADTVYVIGEGKIVAKGTPTETLTTEVINKVYQVQARLNLKENYLPSLAISSNNACLRGQ